MNKQYFTLITGASSGIGQATAKLLAQHGRNLILIARRKDRLDTLKKELESQYAVEILVFQLDVQNLAAIEKFFDKIKDKKIDVLINNAGLARGRLLLENYQWDDIEQMINTNIKGFLKVAQLSIPFLKETKGHIINLSSIAGIEAYEGASIYCGTKAFVKMISKSLRIDLAGTGIRVTDIAPGAVNTEFSLVRFDNDKSKASAVYDGYIPLYAEDIADCILFSLNRPASVNIQYMLVMPTAQVSATRISSSCLPR